LTHSSLRFVNGIPLLILIVGVRLRSCGPGNKKPTESVDIFITDIQNAARLVPINDPDLLRFAIVKGLKPAIRLQVLQTVTRSLQGVIEAVQVAEAALSASAPNDDLSKLTDQVALLLAKLEAPPAVVTSTPALETCFALGKLKSHSVAPFNR